MGCNCGKSRQKFKNLVQPQTQPSKQLPNQPFKTPRQLRIEARAIRIANRNMRMAARNAAVLAQRAKDEKSNIVKPTGSR